VAAASITTLRQIRESAGRIAGLSATVEADRASAKAFLYAEMYNAPAMEEGHRHGAEAVEGLFDALMDDPGLLPPDHRAQIPGEGLARTVGDYIAGMTDNFIEVAWTRVGKP
jgi:dGTPase